MSSAPPRPLAAFGRALRAVAWTAVLVVLAASGAGLVGQFWHPPGSDARAELTYAGDTAMQARLDVASTDLRAIATDIERLAGEAKTALEEVASPDSTRLRDSLERGGQAAATIDLKTLQLRESLIGLPGDGPAAEIDYSNATLVRRAAILAAIDAAGGVAGQWQGVTGRATDAAHLTGLIDQHNRSMIDATTRGRDRKYAEATALIDSALLTVDQVVAVRKRIIASPDRTVLDEWIDRNRTWDIALKALYLALIKSKGANSIEVQSAYREEQLARAQLPQDNRAIIVIVAEVARGGLTQAVLAIEEAHGQIDRALEESQGPSAAAP